MSKFYRYGELKKHPPSVQRVTRVRDSVLGFLEKNVDPRSAVAYGSTL
jgi:hypothetical protein